MEMKDFITQRLWNNLHNPKGFGENCATFHPKGFIEI